MSLAGDPGRECTADPHDLTPSGGEPAILDAMDAAIAGQAEVAFVDDSLEPHVRGFLDRPLTPEGTAGPGGIALETDALILTHGAGSNARAPLLVGVAHAFAQAGFTVLRLDLPFRQMRPHGPPLGTGSVKDREGLHNALAALRKLGFGSRRRIFLGGHSYGGRQATMLASSDGTLADGLLLLSYPLHPPRRSSELRTGHFVELRTPALFVHGSRDPFGSLEEMDSALRLIPAPNSLLPVEGAGHDLGFRRGTGHAASELPRAVVAAFTALMGSQGRNAART